MSDLTTNVKRVRKERAVVTDQELRRLNRKDLLELLISKTRECEVLREKLGRTETALQDRRIEIGQSGSLAEAALRINGVFKAADEAARQYLENLHQQEEEVEAAIARKSEEMARLEEETAARCQAMEEASRKKTEEYWADVSKRLELFCKEHKELKALLSMGEET